MEWDHTKLNNWFYRRFIGDRKHEGAGTGKQRLLDSIRAKWQNYAAMRPYYETHVQALVQAKIVTLTDGYDEADKDEAGHPKLPIAKWYVLPPQLLTPLHPPP